MEFSLAWNVLRSQKAKSNPRIPSGQRVYAIGDVHGRADLLASLFARIDADLQKFPVGIRFRCCSETTSIAVRIRDKS